MLIMRDGRIIDSRALKGAASRARRLRLDMAQPTADLNTLLEAQAGVSQVVVDGNVASFLFEGDLSARHGLLKNLIEDGVAIAGLSEDRVALQDAYIAQIHEYDSTPKDAGQ